MVGLVKAVVDLPGVVFVLLCQREIISRALHDPAGEPNNGEQFLEKIVQIPLHVPAAPTGRLQTLLDQEIQKVVEDKAYAERWDWTRWHELYTLHAAAYLRTLRQTKRYVGSFDFYLGQHLHKGKLEVNPVDLAALELVRLCEPTVFEQLARRRLVSEPALNRRTGALLDENPEIDEACASLVAGIPESRRSAMIALLKWLFPQLIAGNSDLGEDSWDQGLRVCHRKHYPIYFQLVLPDDQASTADFDRLKQAVDQGREAIFRELRQLHGSGLLSDVLARFRLFVEESSPGHSRNLFQALCELGDQLPETGGYREENALRSTAYFIAADLLRPLDTEARAEWLEEVLDASTGLDIPVRLAGAINRPDGAGKVDFKLNETRHQTIIVKAAQRIRRAATDGSFWRSVWIRSLLEQWAKAETEVPVKDWLAAQVISEARAIQLAIAFISISKGVRREIPRLWGADLDRFIDVATLAKLTEGRGHEVAASRSARERDAIYLLREARNLKDKKLAYEEVELPKSLLS